MKVKDIMSILFVLVIRITAIRTKPALVTETTATLLRQSEDHWSLFQYYQFTFLNLSMFSFDEKKKRPNCTQILHFEKITFICRKIETLQTEKIFAFQMMIIIISLSRKVIFMVATFKQSIGRLHSNKSFFRFSLTTP